jgi:hypothetical protein
LRVKILKLIAINLSPPILSIQGRLKGAIVEGALASLEDRVAEREAAIGDNITQNIDCVKVTELEN